MGANLEFDSHGERTEDPLRLLYHRIRVHCYRWAVGLPLDGPLEDCDRLGPELPYTAGPTSETSEYDRVLGTNGITNLNGGAVPGRGLITETTHADGKFQRFAYDAYGNKRWEDNELRNAT